MTTQEEAAYRKQALIGEEVLLCRERVDALRKKFESVPIMASLSTVGAATIVFLSCLRVSYIEEFGELPPKNWKPEDQRVDRVRSIMRLSAT